MSNKLDIYGTFKEAVKRYPESEEEKRKKQKSCTHIWKWLQFNNNNMYGSYSLYQCPKCLELHMDK